MDRLYKMFNWDKSLFDIFTIIYFKRADQTTTFVLWDIAIGISKSQASRKLHLVDEICKKSAYISHELERTKKWFVWTWKSIGNDKFLLFWNAFPHSEKYHQKNAKNLRKNKIKNQDYVIEQAKKYKNRVEYMEKQNPSRSYAKSPETRLYEGWYNEVYEIKQKKVKAKKDNAIKDFNFWK